MIMKKIISIISIFTMLFLTASANKSVIVSAVVGALNHAPVVISVNPSSNPRMLGVNKTQYYTIYFRDDEKNTVTYTISPNNWYTNPISWTINVWDYDGTNWAYINFLYLAPSTPVSNEKVTVTINDWSNVVVKELNLYIY